MAMEAHTQLQVDFWKRQIRLCGLEVCESSAYRSGVGLASSDTPIAM